MTPASTPAPAAGRPPLSRRIDPAIATAYGCIVAMILIGALYSPNFLAPAYLLQQLKVAAFLGVIASGMMLVILIGHIDLSVPWVLTTGAMMASAMSSYGPVGAAFAIPAGLLCGAAFGLLNGFIVGYMRVPSMIVTMAVNAVAQGLMVAYTGGFAPQDSASPLMRWLATGTLIPNVANGVLVWALVGLATLFLLGRTTFGRALYAIGNRERAAYLSGLPTRRVTLLAFVASGTLSALGGILLAGYAAKASQSMGDAYLLPSIAAVVLGGTHVLGGKGSYFGTIAGVILVTLLQSILSVMQIEEAGRQLIYGGVIVAMLLLYGRQSGR
ncbi:ABC transporter permease [Methyloraptor flagellatus]|uniref:ABC transporter permease n=1 Tax=Methyloraptor flagellatus TaxID=3162530 RepID=A0AAU7X9T3_9HYPH